MLLRDIIRISLQQLNQNLRRSLLAALGFMVGVAALMAMDSLGRATSYYLTSFMENLGQANVVRVNVLGLKGMGAGGRSFTLPEVERMRREVNRVRNLSAVTTDYDTRLNHGRSMYAGRLSGVEPAFQGIFGLKPARGRWLVPQDLALADNVIVLGAEAAQRLFGKQDPINQAVMVDKVPFKVAGVLEPSIFEDVNGSGFVPLTSALRRVYDCRKLNMVLIQTQTMDDVEQVAAEARGFMAKRSTGPLDRFEVRINREALSRVRDSILVLKVFVSAVSAVTLFLGGIGIMNVFLAAIAERKAEIGIRKAVGATEEAIAVQILTEVAIICLISAGLGLALGLGLVRAVVWFTGRAELGVVSPLHAAAYIAFALIVGVGFSLSPALRAARKDVVEAIKGN